MDRTMSCLKEEIMDLFGSISVDELVTNVRAQEVIGEIHNELKHVSIVEGHFNKRREQN